MSQIGKDIKLLLGIGNEILLLKRQLQEATRTEDFDRAIVVRNELKKHEQKRDGFDVTYETSRFVGMMTMDEPSERFK